MHARDQRRIRPAECTAQAAHARFPFAQQGGIDVGADGFQYRADIGEVQIESGEAARIVERQ